MLEAGVMVAATHGYKVLAERRGWLRRSPGRLLPVVLTAFVTLLVVYLAAAWSGFQVATLYCACEKGFSGAWVGAAAGGLRYVAIWLLAYHGYHYARQNAVQRARAAYQSQLAAEARLAKLSGEINPHFLFNALNSVKALTRSDTRRARRGIDQLASLLRYSLKQSARPLVPWPEERAMTERYLELERLRFEDRLSVSWDVPDWATHYLIPPMTLHTLVENAIKHGVAHSAAGGRVHIAARNEKDTWEIRVSNNGTYRSEEEEGVGLTNLTERLRLQYGNQAEFRIKNSTEGTVTATIILPR